MADLSSQSFIVWDEEDDLLNNSQSLHSATSEVDDHKKLRIDEAEEGARDAKTPARVKTEDDSFNIFGKAAYKDESEDEQRDEKRSTRLRGGRMAVPKKISADHDSEDEMIIDMHAKGIAYTDIANALISEGRHNYNPKTIHSRQTRIRAAKAAQRDILLEEELTDWHEGEDEVLLAAVAKADKMIKDEITKLKTRRWEHAAKSFYHSRPTTYYSAKACRRRFQELLTGTARIPPELDDDPEARAERKAERLVAFQQRKVKEKTAQLDAKERARKLQQEQDIARVAKRVAQQEKKKVTAQKKLKRVQEQLVKTEAAVAKSGQQQAATVERLGIFQRSAEKNDQLAKTLRAEQEAATPSSLTSKSSIANKLKAANRSLAQRPYGEPPTKRARLDGGDDSAKASSPSTLRSMASTNSQPASTSTYKNTEYIEGGSSTEHAAGDNGDGNNSTT